MLCAIEAGDTDFAAQGRRRKADRRAAEQRRAVALEHLVPRNMDEDIEVASGGTIGPGLAFARNADARAFVDARAEYRPRLSCARQPGLRPGICRTGFSITSPRPWQVGQVRSTTKKPCCARTLPWPAHRLQRRLPVPGVAPEPSQVPQVDGNIDGDLG